MFLSLLLSLSSFAEAGSYHMCKISNGQIFTCDGAWYQGQAVVEKDGSYHMCKISNGQIFTCDGAWYQGEAVVYKR